MITTRRFFHFVVSLLSKEVVGSGKWFEADSPDGRSVQACLRRCLNSLVNQTSPDVVVHVISHDVPPLPDALRARVRFHHVGFSPPTKIDLATYARLAGKQVDKLPDLHRKMMGDKYSKLKEGLSIVLDDPESRFVMFVDHDDMIHRDVADFALTRSEEVTGGFAVTKGYTWIPGEDCFRELDGFARVCGSCNAVRISEEERASWIRTRDVNQAFSGDAESRAAHWLYAGHGNMMSRLQAAGRTTGKFPFRGAVYVVGTGSNHSGTRRAGSEPVPLTQELRGYFGLLET